MGLDLELWVYVRQLSLSLMCPWPEVYRLLVCLNVTLSACMSLLGPAYLVRQ